MSGSTHADRTSDQACGTLNVAATSASGSGVSLSGIRINASCQVTASVIAGCAATASTFNLVVTDDQGATATSLLSVNVTANTALTLGVYPATGPILVGADATVTPSAPPSDNGSIPAIAATAPGFGGTISANPLTGAVTVSNAGPVGTFTVSVKATDNFSVTFTKGRGGNPADWFLRGPDGVLRMVNLLTTSIGYP
jgi:hypothetical protein